jgi:hypothetical protein
MRNLTAFLCLVVLTAGAARAADEEIILTRARIAFTPPAGDWRVNTSLSAPVAALLDNKKLVATITITYDNNELYDVKVNQGFLRDRLEKQEKNTYKLTKPNYERVSLDDRKFPAGKAPCLQFTYADELGVHHTAIYALANEKMVIFIAAESGEREWDRTKEALDAVLNSVRLTP